MTAPAAPSNPDAAGSADGTGSAVRNVVLGVAGGIAAYKAVSLLRLLREAGHAVRVVPTPSALTFVGAATWEALSGQPVRTGVFDAVTEVEHVTLGRNADLVVVAPATADLLARARSLGVERSVYVTGLVERDALAPYIAMFDIALQPEVTAYASPLKLFEYMALNRAIVAPDASNIREVLTNGTDALLFEPNNPVSFARAVRALALDPALRERLGQCAGDKIIREDITWARNARRAISLIEKHQGTKG